MDSLLDISNSNPGSGLQEKPSIRPVAKEQPVLEGSSAQNITRINNAQEILIILQGQPTYESLFAALKWLAKANHDFKVWAPGPLSTQIVGVLVNDIVPSHWPMLRDEGHEKAREWLIECLTSITGIGSLIARLKSLRIQNNKGQSSTEDTDAESLEVLEVLNSLLNKDDFLSRLWVNLHRYVEKPLQQQILWKELILMLASGRVVSAAAEVIVSAQESQSQNSWLAESRAFAKWLGRTIRVLIISNNEYGVEVFDSAASMLGKALSLGHNARDHLVETAFYNMLNGVDQHQHPDIRLFEHLTTVNKIKVLTALLSILSQRCLVSKKSNQHTLILGSAALVQLLTEGNSQLEEFLIKWLCCISGGCVGAELAIRRAVIAAVSSYEGLIEESLRKLLTQFGDKIHIQHAPVVVQEVCCQNLLVSIGRVYRKDKNLLTRIARSSTFLNAISNRLASSSERQRFLGMIVGMAVSELVDDPEQRMKFSADVLRGADADWYLELTGIHDRVGKHEHLRSITGSHQESHPSGSHLSTNPRKTEQFQERPKPSASKIVSIVEIESSDEDDLPTYAKPDSDAEDSDEDPTLINRNKPTPPVYIRDLISYLKDTENYERHVLALSHASSLIRRKSSYGTEVKDHLEDLASLICGMKDEYDIESWQKQRLAAMVATILADPSRMGRWFASMIFSGDYSMSQRASMLTAVTMAARELAGYSSQDADLTLAPDPSTQLFPSKQLPTKYAKLYSASTAPTNVAARQLETQILTPLAAQVADNASKSTPSILKTRTFSSRLAVESRKKPINNKLATLLSEHFFFPLTNKWRVYSMTHAGSNSNVFILPFLHSHILKTLALLLAASGPGTLSLQALTGEFWSLLLSTSTRNAAAKDLPVLESVLFGLLTLLDVNGASVEGEDSSKRRLAEEFGEQLIQTQNWVGVVLEGLSAGKHIGREEERIRMLAAGVLVRVEEVVERYQRILMGMLATV